MMGFWDAVASAGPHADTVRLTSDNHTSLSSLMEVMMKYFWEPFLLEYF